MTSAWRWRAACGLALVVMGTGACGGAASPSAARESYPTAAAPATERASSGGADYSTQSTTTGTAAPQSAPASEPRPTVMQSAPSGGNYATPTGGATGGDRMSYWEGQLDRASSTLSNSNECRDICRASGDICTAAHEICTLTGDGDTVSPGDGRCSRARGACEQATRQRNGSCPVCPRE